jgi:amidohydrolase
MKDPNGGEVKPVMHACEHYIHVVCLMAAVELLQRAKRRWSGNLICVFQQAEETLSGVQAMFDDGHSGRIPQPDIVLGQHAAKPRAEDVLTREDQVLTAADRFDVQVIGRGGHGAAPQACVDPTVLTHQVVLRLQTITGREIPSRTTAIITCRSFHAGQVSNINPDYTDLKIDLRTYEPEIRDKAPEAIRRTV